MQGVSKTIQLNSSTHLPSQSLRSLKFLVNKTATPVKYVKTLSDMLVGLHGHLNGTPHTYTCLQCISIYTGTYVLLLFICQSSKYGALRRSKQ